MLLFGIYEIFLADVLACFTVKINVIRFKNAQNEMLC